MDELDNIADGQLYRMRRGVGQGNRGSGRAKRAGREGRGVASVSSGHGVGREGALNESYQQ